MPDDDLADLAAQRLEVGAELVELLLHLVGRLRFAHARLLESSSYACLRPHLGSRPMSRRVSLSIFSVDWASMEPESNEARRRL